MSIHIVTVENGVPSVSALPGTEVCDFCCGPNPVKDYKALDFMMHDFEPTLEAPNMSVGDWSACAECAKLVDANEWDALIDRVVAAIKIDNPIGKEWVRVTYTRLRKAMQEYKEAN